MSGTEPQQLVEQHSSVKVIRNAKGDPQWEVKVMATGESPEEIEAARRLAVEQYEELELSLVGVVQSERRDRDHLA